MTGNIIKYQRLSGILIAVMLLGSVVTVNPVIFADDSSQDYSTFNFDAASNIMQGIGGTFIKLFTEGATPKAYGQATATITTDKADYAPGETVTIFGKNFIPRATITLTIDHPDNNLRTWTVSADEYGSFTTTYTLDGFRESYTVTATDGTNTAYTTFTDKVAPTVTLVIHNASHTSISSIAVGSALHASVSVSGSAGTPTGSVTFKRYTTSGCTGSSVDETVTLTSGSAESTAFTPTSVGSGFISYKASYSGDSAYTGGSDPCAFVTVTTASPTITTTLSTSSITVGSGTVTDSSDIQNGFNPGGTITYTVYTDSSCTNVAAAGFPGSTTSSAVAASGSNGDQTDSAAWTPPSAGTFYWQARYSGDTNNNSATSVCTSETLTVNKATPAVATEIHSEDSSHAAVTSVTVGKKVHDKATVSGGYNPTSTTVDFMRWNNGNCNGSPDSTESNVSLISLMAESADFTTISAAVGPSVSYKAHYDGDANNEAVDSDCEPLTVNKASPTVGTAVSSATITIGDSATDTATLSGGYNVDGGTVDFTAYSDASCTTSVFTSNDKTISGGSATSDAFTPGAVGTYYWIAHYDEDANNNEFTTSCGDTGETLTVLPVSVFTTISVTSSALCSFDKDSATGQQFRLIFTPNQNSPTNFKLAASNPGQFYDNVFVTATDASEGDLINLTIVAPTPFVTQGAVFLHVYKSVSTNSDGCFLPSNDITSQVTIDIVDTDPLTITVSGTMPDTELFYVNIHIDYGLKGTSPYAKCNTNDAWNANCTAVLIPDLTSYTFEVSGTVVGSSTVQSKNAFKRDPGFAGFVTYQGSGQPAPNVKVEIYSPKNVKLGTVYTDQDGYYMFNYKYSGKEATFTVKLPAYNLSQQVKLKSNSFAYANFQIPP